MTEMYYRKRRAQEEGKMQWGTNFYCVYPKVEHCGGPRRVTYTPAGPGASSGCTRVEPDRLIT